MARGGQAELLTSWPKNNKKRRSHPDWAAVKRTVAADEKQPKLKNMLPGDTKLSSKWTSSMVQRGDQKAFLRRPNTVGPVLQVYNYCLQANARYGFIITDKELVVLRIGVIENLGKSSEQTEQTARDDVEDEPTETIPSHEQESQDSQTEYISEAQRRARRSGKVELMSIPWDCYENGRQCFDSVLTVNLALWWLHILAGVASDIELEYPELSEDSLPTMCSSNNASFSAGLGDLNLATASFGSHDEDRGRSARKRKPKSSSHSRVKMAKRKMDSN